MRTGFAAAIEEFPRFAGLDAAHGIEEHAGLPVGRINVADAQADNRSAFWQNDPVGGFIGFRPDEIDDLAVGIAHGCQFDDRERQKVQDGCIHG